MRPHRGNHDIANFVGGGRSLEVEKITGPADLLPALMEDFRVDRTVVICLVTVIIQHYSNLLPNGTGISHDCF